MTELYLLDCLGGHSVGKTDRPQTPFWGLEGLQYERAVPFKHLASGAIVGASGRLHTPNFRSTGLNLLLTILARVRRAPTCKVNV